MTLGAARSQERDRPFLLPFWCLANRGILARNVLEFCDTLEPKKRRGSMTAEFRRC
jgi:hypothetical protein